MSQILVSAYYQQVRREIIAEVNSLSAEDLEGTDAAEWVGHYMAKHSLAPIKLKDTPPILSQRVERSYRESDFSHIGRHAVEREIAVIALPIEVNERIQVLVSMRGDTWRSFAGSDWAYKDGSLVVETNPNPEAATQAIDTVKHNIGLLTRGIEQGNDQLPAFIREIVENRMETVGARASAFQSLAESLGAELKLNPNEDRRLAQAPRVKQAIEQLKRPEPKRVKIPRLQPDQLQTILDVIESQCATFERTPGAVSKLDEEEIRDLILGSLNGAFDLGATGEAFSKRGKTDIYLPVPGGSVFIAECKIWDGQKIVGEAVEQILGYLTWRDAYGVVLMFSRNAGFSNVRGNIPEAIAEIESLRGEVLEVDAHHWTGRHVLPGDDNQTVEIHYLVYDIHSDR